MRKNGERSGDRRYRIDLQSEAKEKQALKLAEIREALVTAGYNTTAKQAAVLGLGRSTTWALLNRDKRAGPSAKVIKRILSSPQVPKAVRRKVEQYVKQKIRGLLGIAKRRRGRLAINFSRCERSRPDCFGSSPGSRSGVFSGSPYQATRRQ